MTKILACIDGSVYSDSVADHAAWAAKELNASVALLHTLGEHANHSAIDLSGNLDAGERETLLAELANLDAQKAKLAQKRGRAILKLAAERVRAEGLETVSEFLRHGDVVDTLKDLEKDADLVVIGKRGEAADFAKLHLGSNLERVLRGSSKPVLVASRAFQAIRRVLIAFDGGPSIAKAIDFIADQPLLAGVACHIFAVGPDQQTEAKMRDAEARLRQVGLQTTLSHENGNADDMIARQVENSGIDLLVMGAYGHSRIRALIIGSTTTALIRSCKVPVLLFR